MDGYSGERGESKAESAVFNARRSSLGGWTFQYGLPEMLGFYYGDYLQDVEIEVVGGGVQVP